MTPSKDQSEMNALKVQVGIMSSQMLDTKDAVDRIEKKIDGMQYATTAELAAFMKDVKENYTPLNRYAPVEKVVFGLVALILMGVGGAVIAGVVK